MFFPGPANVSAKVMLVREVVVVAKRSQGAESIARNSRHKINLWDRSPSFIKFRLETMFSFIHFIKESFQFLMCIMMDQIFL